MASPTAKPDAIAVLVRDHREVDELFERFDLYDDTIAVKTKRELLMQITRALSVHAAVEEEVLYPAMRGALPDGDHVVQQALSDHQQVKQTLATIEAKDPGDPAVPSHVKALAAQVRAHVREEEQDLFPRLEVAIDRATLQAMGAQIEKLRKIAPTRPHPEAPNTPPANVVVGAVAGVVDRVLDMIDHAAEKGREAVQSRGDKRP
jgi:hemerythrin superfamily protein